MFITLYVTKDCSTCKKVERDIKKITKDIDNIKLQIYDVNERKPPNIVIVPALFIGDELYCYGEFDSSKLSKILYKNKAI